MNFGDIKTTTTLGNLWEYNKQFDTCYRILSLHLDGNRIEIPSPIPGLTKYKVEWTGELSKWCYCTSQSEVYVTPTITIVGDKITYWHLMSEYICDECQDPPCTCPGKKYGPVNLSDTTEHSFYGGWNNAEFRGQMEQKDGSIADKAMKENPRIPWSCWEGNLL